MDVTFTNVLEGARQYFQGLPAATGSAASPSSSTISYGSAASGSYTTTTGALPTAAATPAAANSSATTTAAEAPGPAPAAYQNRQQAGGNETSSNVQYWPATAGQLQEKELHEQQEKNIIMPQYQQLLDTQLPSHTTPSPHSQSQSQESNSIISKQPVHSYHYQPPNPSVAQAYQFSRPSSHEAPPPNSVLQYSSHYSQTTHRPINVQASPHHQPSASHPVASQVRPPSRPHDQMPPSPKTQSYHQLQPPRHHTPSAQQMYVNNYQQQAKQPSSSYYPPPSNSQSQPATGVPPPVNTQSTSPYPASSQAYMPNHQFTSHSYSPHSHSPVQTQTQYLSTKANYDTTTNKPEISSGGQLPSTHQQAHRTTHNLPPIAALSTVNYHSNKNSREAVQRLANHRHRTPASSASVTVPSTVSTSQSTRVPVQYTQHGNGTSHYNTNAQQHISAVRSGTVETVHTHTTTNGPTYPSYPAASSQAYTCTTTSSFTSSSSSTSSNVYNQSSYPQHFQKGNKLSYQQQQQAGSKQSQSQYQSTASKDYSYQTATSSNRMVIDQTPAAINNVNQQQQHMRPENPQIAATAMLAKHVKRESPLDLSVKTVRTSADSTALDDIEMHSSEAPHRSNKSTAYTTSRSTMPPPMQMPSSGPPYHTYEHHSPNNHQRHVNIRAASAGAPKVDFLPNFNVSSLHHSQRPQHVEDNRQSVQHLNHHDKNHSTDQNKYARNVTYNNKVYYQQQQQQQPFPYHPSTSYQQHTYNNNSSSITNSNNNLIPNAVQPNPYSAAAQVPAKRSTEGLPRIDFPTPGHSSKGSSIYAAVNVAREAQRKRPADPIPPTAVPNKIPKMDAWRQTIDQQIEQRLSSYANSRKQQQEHSTQQGQKQTNSNHHFASKPLVNGNAAVPNHHRPRDVMYYPQTHHASYPQAQQSFTSNAKQYHAQPPSHNQTYVPTAVGQHHYPPHANLPNHHQQPHDQLYQQNALSRTNSNAKLTTSPLRNNNNLGGAADKRVLSILRNSLEIKGAKEAQKKLEQIQVKPQEMHVNHIRSSGVQQPSTDVTAPLQPKSGIVGRHNVSPFTAASLLERNSNTPPIYKFHFPRAVDSVRFETEGITTLKDNHHHNYNHHHPRQGQQHPSQATPGQQQNNMQYPTEEITFAQNTTMILPTGASASSCTADLDGLAAFLAARIRTKAEKKQVDTTQGGQIPNVPTSNTTTAVFLKDENTNKNAAVVAAVSSATDQYIPTIQTATAIANTYNNNTISGIPKLIKEQQGVVVPPRRRLFSRSEEEANMMMLVTTASSSSNSITVPSRDSALRSSSETSVFDFRDSDSEGEMPVLERQSLTDMRRDRKSLNKPQQTSSIVETDTIQQHEEKHIHLKEEEEEIADPFWSETCDKFLEQLKTSGGKKRGRRKKVIEPDVLAKLETVTKENPVENLNTEVVVKLENIDVAEETENNSRLLPELIVSNIKVKIEEEEEIKPAKKEETEEIKPSKKEENEEIKPTKKEDNTDTMKIAKVEDDSDSDVPLIRRKVLPVKIEDTVVTDGEDSILDAKKDKIGAKIKLEYSSDSSDSDSETIQSVSDKLRSRKAKQNNKENETEKGMVLRSADSSPSKKINPKMRKKAIFGDGSDFHPGWEEEVYRYKKSLRMPSRLISITRAPHWHRVSTSLPDLDPCSPAASSLTDDTEFSTIMHRRSMPINFTDSNTGKLKRDLVDSDMDSNSSFTFQKAAYDSEEASSSSLRISALRKVDDKLKNKENNNSILDVLVERYSKHKRKKLKGKEQKPGPKIIPKATESLELLPTPGLGIGSPEKETPKPGRGRPRIHNKEDHSSSSNKFEMNDSVYLGFFRKQTVNNFRDTFKKNSGFLAVDEQFSTLVLKSRTRTETRVMKQRATIREVFGEERPASAPPIACREDEILDTSQDSVINGDRKSKMQSSTITTTTSSTKIKETLSPTRTGLRSSSERRCKHIFVKKLQRGRKRTTNLLKVLASKTLPSDVPNEQQKDIIKSETLLESVKSETTPPIGTDGQVIVIPPKKRLKLRNMRRKFSSGFDYIRKKKKQVKKDSVDGDNTVKPKRRGIIPRPSPESVQDIQREIKTWVMNKGVGESHLHRAARLGYTDVTAYCLEKMDCVPSPKDNAGYTPLHEACSRGHLDIARLLLQYGANVSESAQGGIRPLHEAAENGYVEIIRLLLSYGADPMLATYSGLTPLSLVTDDETKSLLKHYMADVQGLPAPPWAFNGPAPCFDHENSGFDTLEGAPSPDPLPEDEDIEIEMSEQLLPNLYTLRGEGTTDRWILLQELSMLLKIKSRDTLLRQINGSSSPSTSSSATPNKNLLRELKMADFMEQAHCCQLLCANEKLNVRSTKIALVKYTDKVKQLLGVERVVVTTR